MMGWYYGGAGWAGWLVMAVVMVAFWGLVVFAVVALFRGIGRTNEPADQTPRRDPLRILDDRFARGDLDVDEYHARQDVLRGTDR
jgi:putative membrane protein